MRHGVRKVMAVLMIFIYITSPAREWRARFNWHFSAAHTALDVQHAISHVQLF